MVEKKKITFLSDAFNNFIKGMHVANWNSPVKVKFPWCYRYREEKAYYEKVYPYAYKMQEYLESQQLFLHKRSNLALVYKLITRAEHFLFKNQASYQTQIDALDKILAFYQDSKDKNDLLLLCFSSTLVIVSEYLTDAKEDHKRMNYLARKVGENYFYQIFFYHHTIKPLDNVIMQQLKLLQKKSNIEDSSRDAKYELGRRLLEILELTGIVKIEIKTYFKKKQIVVALTDLGRMLVSEDERENYLFWQDLPMFVPPLSLNEELKEGGYLNSRTILTDKVYHKGFGDNVPIILNGKLLMSTINYLAQVPLRIDYERFFELSAMLQGNAKKKNSIENISIDPLHKVRLYYLIDRFTALYKLGKIIAIKAYPDFKNITEEMLRREVTYRIFFYFPVILDFRGRANEIPKLSKQTFHAERSLILLPEKRKLGVIGVKVLIAYYLCLFGQTVDQQSIKNKMTFNQLIDYYRENLSYYSNSDCIKKAKKAYLFQKLYEEFKILGLFNENFNIEEIAEKETDVGVYLDMTTSGIQILATFVVEIDEILKYLNFSPSDHNNVPYSFYSLIANDCNEELVAMDKEYANFFSGSDVKKIVMSYPYGISNKEIMDILEKFLFEEKKFTALMYDRDLVQSFLTVTQSQNKIEEMLRKRRLKWGNLLNDIKMIEENKKATALKEQEINLIHKSLEHGQAIINELNKIRRTPLRTDDISWILTALFEEFPKYLLLRQLRSKLAKLITKIIRNRLNKIEAFFKLMKSFSDALQPFNQTITFPSLLGDLLINQKYREKINIKRFLPNKFSWRLKKRKYQFHFYVPGTRARVKNRNSFMPNFTHTQDGALVRAVVHHLMEKYPNERIIYGQIFDSYLIHASDYTRFVEEYKLVYIDLFKKENIENLYLVLGKPLDEIKKSSAFRSKEKQFLKLQLIYDKIGHILLNHDARDKMRENIAKSQYLVYF